MNIFDYVQECKDKGMSAREAESEYLRYIAEARQNFIEDYENRPETWAGWSQQDTIDMYRREQ